MYSKSGKGLCGIDSRYLVQLVMPLCTSCGKKLMKGVKKDREDIETQLGFVAMPLLVGHAKFKAGIV